MFTKRLTLSLQYVVTCRINPAYRRQEIHKQIKHSQTMAPNSKIDISSTDLPKHCQWIDFPQFKDLRGTLCVAQNGHEQLPMEFERVFWISGVPQDGSRGEHAHRTCSEIIVPICGSFEVELTDGSQHIVVTMDNPSRGLLIGPMVWCRLYHFTEDSVCLCLASGGYDAEGYINDFEDFIKEVKD